MSLKHCILGFLNYASMSGYDLMKAFESSVSFFWKAVPSQIYSTLEKLEKDKLIECERITQQDRPNKKIYSLTEKGRQEWKIWMEKGESPVNLKNALLLKVFFMGALPKDQAEAFFKELIDSNNRELQSMEQVPSSIAYYQTMTSPKDALFWSFTYEYGKAYLKMCNEWAQNCLEKIDENFDD